MGGISGIIYIASSLCFALSVGIGNTHVARVKEGWTERAILYVALIGRPGSNKSHPLSFAMQPLFEHDTAEVVKFKQAYREYDQVMMLSKKEREEQGFNAMPEEPLLKKYVVSDITPECLASIHENNKRGICLYSDELALWFKNFNLMKELIRLKYQVDDNGDLVSTELPFDHSSKEVLYGWQRKNTDLCNSESNEELQGTYSKLEIYAVRFGLILQEVRWLCGEAKKDCIDATSVEGAIELVEYFRQTACKAHLIIDTTARFEQLPSDKVKLYHALPPDFSTADGIKVASTFSMSPDSFKRFLSDLKGNLLDNYKHGCYRKLI